jgi:hypothetical protein
MAPGIQFLQTPAEQLDTALRIAAPDRQFTRQTQAYSHNWLRVSHERKRDVEKRCSVGTRERFEGCEKIDRYAIFCDGLSGLQMTLT